MCVCVGGGGGRCWVFVQLDVSYWEVQWNDLSENCGDCFAFFKEELGNSYP